MGLVRKCANAALFGALALAFAPERADAQRVGLVAGYTFSKLTGLEDAKAKNRTGVLAGLSLLLPLPGPGSFQPELLFVSKGSKVETGGLGNQEVRLDYLEIPLLLRADILQGPVRPHLYAGPTVGFKLNCSVDIETSGVPEGQTDCKRDNFKPRTLDWGAAVGGGVDLSTTSVGLTAGVRYGFGLRNVLDDDTSTFNERVRNGTFALYAGLRFGF